MSQLIPLGAASGFYYCYMKQYLDELQKLSADGLAVYAVDRSHRVVFWSTGCEAIYGYRAEEIIGSSCFEVFRGRDVHGNIRCHESCATMHQVHHQDFPIHDFLLRISTKDGGTKSLCVRIEKICDSRSSEVVLAHIVRELGECPEEAQRLEEMRERTHELTPREREVLLQLATGRSTQDIAIQLNISTVTVRNHIQRLLEKLDLPNKTAAVVYAFRTGVVNSATLSDREQWNQETLHHARAPHHTLTHRAS